MVCLGGLQHTLSERLTRTFIGANIDSGETVEDGIFEKRRVNPTLELKTRYANAVQLFLGGDSLVQSEEFSCMLKLVME